MVNKPLNKALFLGGGGTLGDIMVNLSYLTERNGTFWVSEIFHLLLTVHYSSWFITGSLCKTANQGGLTDHC